MGEKGKRILILGNGFDLAHGLPTKYDDFLNFCQCVDLIWTQGLGKEKKERSDFFRHEYAEKLKINELISSQIEYAIENRINTKNGQYSVESSGLPVFDEIHALLKDNVWYRYFGELRKKGNMRGNNWIDFESEIRFIISRIDQKSLSLQSLLKDVFKEYKDSPDYIKLDLFKSSLYHDWEKKVLTEQEYTVRDFRAKCVMDLEHLIRVLELYLSEFVEKIKIEKKIPEISVLNPDYVINFNYTNTYERTYGEGKVFYIHGRAVSDRPTEENNMVLGIDEYWSEKERDEHTDFTILKKFAQRILKNTGNESYKYLKEIRSLYEAGKNIWTGCGDMTAAHPDGVSYIYVFGHSLDITDRDVLADFIGDEATSVRIFCRDKGTEGELMANVIRLIGEDGLINKRYHVPTKLDFIIPKNTKAE